MKSFPSSNFKTANISSPRIVYKIFSTPFTKGKQFFLSAVGFDWSSSSVWPLKTCLRNTCTLAVADGKRVFVSFTIQRSKNWAERKMENDSEDTSNPFVGNGPVLRKQKGKTEDTTLEKLGNAEDSKPGFVGLKRKLGLFSGISLIVGTMIGSGIFASPRYVMENSGSVGLTLIVWSLCGVLSMFGALMGTMIPLWGAKYAYLLDAFGPLPAFLFSWTAVFVLKPSLVVAIICLTFGAYVIEPIFPGCGDRADLQPIVKLLAALAIGEYKFELSSLRTKL